MFNAIFELFLTFGQILICGTVSIWINIVFHLEYILWFFYNNNYFNNLY